MKSVSFCHIFRLNHRSLRTAAQVRPAAEHASSLNLTKKKQISDVSYQL